MMASNVDPIDAIVIFNHSENPRCYTDEYIETLEDPGEKEKCQDKKLAFEFAKCLAARFQALKICYHGDNRKFRPGSVFDHLIKDIKSSKWIIVIFTNEFIKRQWNKYRSQLAFKMLMDEDNEQYSDRLIPIALDATNLPEIHCATEKLWFDKDWNSEAAKLEWEKLRKLLLPDEVRDEPPIHVSQGLNWTEQRYLVIQDTAAFQEEGEVSQELSLTEKRNLVTPDTAAFQEEGEVSQGLNWTEQRNLVTQDTAAFQEEEDVSQGLNWTEQRNLVTQDTAAFQEEEDGSRSAEIINELSDQLSSSTSVEPDCGLTMPQVTTQAQAETSATPTHDVDLENCMAMQEEADSGLSETIVEQVYVNEHSTAPIDDTANDADSLTEEEQTGSLSDDSDRGEESFVNEMGLFRMRSDGTAFSPEEPNNQFSNDNPGETPSEEASDVAAGGDSPVVSQQLPLSQTAGPSVSNPSEIMVKESTESSQPNGECRETAATKVPGASALVHEKALPPNDSDEVDAKISVAQMVEPMDESKPIDYESAGKSATPTNDIDLENCNEGQGESNGNFADSGYPESSLNQGSVNQHSTEPIEDTANDAVSLTDEEQTGSGDETVFETPPEEPNNQFSNDNPGETSSEEASDVAAGGNSPVVSQQLPLSQTAGPSVSNSSEIMVKESTESSQASGSSVLRPLLPRMVRLLLHWYLQPEDACNSIPTLD